MMLLGVESLKVGDDWSKIHHIVPPNFECDPGDELELIAVTPDGEKFPFAPIVWCTGVQELLIDTTTVCMITVIERGVIANIDLEAHSIESLKSINSRLIDDYEISKNEGFEFPYSVFTGVELIESKKLIHWTDKRY